MDVAVPVVGVAQVIVPPPEEVAHVAQAIFPVAVVSTKGAEAVTAGVPLLVPKVIVGLPAAACGVSRTLPLVLPESVSVPSVVPAKPKTGAAV